MSSRGRGRIQRELLGLLEASGEPVDTFTLAARAYQCQPNADGAVLLNEAQLVNTRRALAGFVKEGKAFDLGRKFRDGRRRWANERIGLYYTIRRMQQENATDAAMGEAQKVKDRIARMLPMIERARTLGIDIDSKSPPDA